MVKPLIVTVQLDAITAEFFDRLRSEHFPPSINHLKAHLTLFHKLPGEEFHVVLGALGAAAAKSAPFRIEVAGLMRLGRGTAYRIESGRLEALRDELVSVFEPWLTRQDREAFRPHVTIQNKVAPHQAQALFDHLSQGFAPFAATAEAVQLWRYEGGPWSPVAAIAFQGAR